MPESPFLMLAGKDKPLKKGEAIAKSPFWESLGEEFAGGWSGAPAYWKYRKKYLKALAEKHGMWLVRQYGNYILTWKKGKKVDIYSSKNLWDVLHKMRDVGKLKRVI
jgi:hypothetical protein